jgi:hypothetical protein
MRGSFRFVYQGYSVVCFTERLPTGRVAPRATIAPPSSPTSPMQWSVDDTTFASEETATEFAIDTVKRLIEQLGETDWTPLR